MKLSTLEVFQSPTKKIRIGKQNDGGYIIASDFNYDCFLSDMIIYLVSHMMVQLIVFHILLKI